MPIVCRQLNSAEIKEAGKIRVKVFVEGQKVPLEEEFDDYDKTAEHFGVFLKGQMVGTARLIIAGKEARIGRLAVLKEFRRQGFGTLLVQAIMASAKKRGIQEIVLGAQLQAIPFYHRLGFQPEGPVFLDAGIAHRGMRWRKEEAP